MLTHQKGQELTLKDIHDISLDMMKVIHQFCVDNNIEYSLDAGSLLGAIRHKGFIPWDDDIDIIMTRPNYEKFCNSFSAQGLKLYRPGDKNYAMTFARVVDVERTLVVDNHRPFTLDKVGYWIDIFPIDGAPTEKDAFNQYMQYCNGRHGFSNHYRFLLGCRNVGIKRMIQKYGFTVLMGRLVRCAVKAVLYGATAEHVLKTFDHTLASVDFYSSEICGSLAFSFNRSKEYKKTDWFKCYELAKFEDAQFYILGGWNEYLSVKFGDYMKLPPIEKRTPHHNFYRVVFR